MTEEKSNYAFNFMKDVHKGITFVYARQFFKHWKEMMELSKHPTFVLSGAVKGQYESGVRVAALATLTKVTKRITEESYTAVVQGAFLTYWEMYVAKDQWYLDTLEDETLNPLAAAAEARRDAFEAELAAMAADGEDEAEEMVAAYAEEEAAEMREIDDLLDMDPTQAALLSKPPQRRTHNLFCDG